MFDIFWWARRRAIKRALSKPAPNTISYSDENIPAINCYTVVLESSDGLSFNIMVKSIDEFGVTGHQFDANEQGYVIDCCVPISFVKNCQIYITHHLMSARTRYSTTKEFWIGECTFHTRRYLIRQRLQQIFFNITTRFRHDRVEILKKLVGNHIEAEESGGVFGQLGGGNTSMALFEDLYGFEIFSHPQWKKEFRRFELILDSFCQGGEMKLTNGKYEITGRAIYAIAHYEETERRHQDSNRLNRVLIILTMVLAAASVASVLLSL